MHLLSILLNPAIVGTLALFLSVIWMLMDQADKTRPMLVFALALNLFYGFLLTTFMSKEGGLLPWKYDHVLFDMDGALGIPAAAIARPLQGALRTPLIVIYQAIVPMMICWFLVTRYQVAQASIILAYVAELVTGPILYSILPACGPAYAFGRQWLQPPSVSPDAIKMAGMPNAFPSLHVGTAFVFVLFAPGRLWRGISLIFLAGTIMATLATGEHYVIDLIPGLAFGCFAAAVSWRRWRSAALFLGMVLCWSLAVRFESRLLIGYPIVTRALAALTVAAAMLEVIRRWFFAPAVADDMGSASKAAEARM